MTHTTILHRFRTTGVAVAVFAIGAGIGWQFADILFRSEEPMPMVASVRFETARPDETTNRQAVSQSDQAAPHRSVNEPRRSNIETAKAQSDEERMRADALQRAERRRQQEAERHAAKQREEQMQKLALAEAQRWAEVAEQSKRFGQGREDVQGVIRAQLERERMQKGAKRVAHAAGVIATDVMSGPVVVRTSSPARQCQGACEARKPAPKRVHKAKTRPSTHGIGCPLQWLEAMMGGSRQHRS